MCFYIGIEDLAANALIEVLNKEEKRFLTYTEIEEYGNRVIQYLSDQNEKAVLILSRESTNALFADYSEYFIEAEVDSCIGIELKKDVSVETLIDKFRGYLSLDVLQAFVDKTTLEALGA